MKRVFKSIVSGFLAGFFIGLGGLGYVVSKAGIGEMGQLIGALCFPIGLFMVCAFGVNLYTGKIGYAFNQEENKFNGIDFIIMLLSNLLGAAAIGLLSYLFFMNNESVKTTAEAVASLRTVYTSFPDNTIVPFFKAMGCGMLVYIGVYLYKKCNNYAERFVVILLPIFLFVYVGMNHCIADFFYICFGMNVSSESLTFILIVILGNSVGAILFDRAIYFIHKKEENKA